LRPQQDTFNNNNLFQTTMIVQLRSLLVVLASAMIASVPALAQTSTWTGTLAASNWSTASNWSGGTVPIVGGSASQIITFSPLGSMGAAATSTLDSAATVNGTFDLTTLNFSGATNAHVFTLAAASGQAFNFNGTSNSINFNTASGTYTFTAPIDFTNGLAITVQGGDPFANSIVSGPITGTGSVTVDNQTNNNSTQIELNGNAGNSYGGLVIGGNTSKTSIAVFVVSGTNLGGGGNVTVGPEGKLILQVDNPLGAGNVVLAGGELTYAGLGAGSTRTVNNNILLTSSSQLQDSTNIQAGSILLLTGTFNLEGGNHILTVDNALGSGTQNTTISGSLINGNLIKSGQGALILSGKNNYGSTTIVQGALQFNSNVATGTGSITILNGGALNAYTYTGGFGNGAELGTVQGWLNSGTIAANSNGAVALAGGTDSESINFTNYNNLMLGAAAASTFTGVITPGSNGYELGGGGSTLTLSGSDTLTGANAVNIGSLGTASMLANGSVISALASTGTVAITNGDTTTGATTVNAGTLRLTAQTPGLTTTFGTLANSIITVNSGALLAIDSVTGTATSLTGSVVRAAGVNLNSGKFTVATETGTLAAPAGSIDSITGTLNFNTGYSTVTVSATSSAQLVAGAISSSGGGGLVNGLALGSAALGTAGSASILLKTTPTIVGTGTFGSGLTGADTTHNLAIIPYLVGEVSATAGGTGTASGTPNTFLTYDTANGLRPLDLTNEYDTTLVAGIADNGNVRVTANGALTTSGTINSLILTGGTQTITDGQTLTIASGAILATTANSTIAPSTSTGTLAFGSTPAYITTNTGTTLTISAVVQSSGGITKFGAGTLTLSNANNLITAGNIVVDGGTLNINGATTTTGTTTVLAGTLGIGNSNALGTGNTSSIILGDTTGNSAVTFSANGVNFSRNITIQSGNIGTVLLDDVTSSGNTSFTGAITLGGSSGVGHSITVENTAGSNFGGFLGVIKDPSNLVAGTAGVVTITTGNDIGFGNSGNSYTGGTILNGGSTISVNNTSGGTGNWFGLGELIINSAVDFNQIGSPATVDGLTGMVWNSDFQIANTGVSFYLPGNSIDLGAVGTAATRNLTIGASSTITGNIINGSNGYTDNLNVVGGSTLTLVGNSTYTGITSISGNTTVSVASINSVVGGTASSNLGAPTSVANGTIQIGATTTGGTLSYTGAAYISDRVINLAGTTGGATIAGNGSGALTLTSTFTTTGVGAKTLTLSGSTAGNTISGGGISDSSGGATSLAKSGSGSWLLSGLSSFTGGTTVNGGDLKVGIATSGVTGALGSTSGSLTMVTGTLDLASFNTGVGSLNGTAGIILNNSTGTTATLTVGNGNFTGTYSGTITDHTTGTGALALNKVGTGSQTLLGSNTYSGGTTVSTGTLIVSNTSGSATGTGSLTLNSGATLSGTGTINGSAAGAGNLIQGNVLVGNGATTDVLTMTASTTTNFSSASLTFNLGTGGGGTTLGNSSQLALGSTPNVVFDGTNGMTLTLNLVGGTAVTTGTQYVLFTSTDASDPFSFLGNISLSGSNVISGSGLNLVINSSQGAGYYNGSYLQLVSLGGSGYDIDLEVQVQAVPEPSTYAMLLGGLVLLIAFQRARRQKN
jgi:autotransporter-associated beta strand protein